MAFNPIYDARLAIKGWFHRSLTVSGWFTDTLTDATGASSPVTVNTGVGLATFTGFAPTASVSNNIAVQAGLGQLTVTGFAPTAAVSNNQNVTAGVGQATYTGLAPTASIGIRVATGVGALTATGFAPAVAVSNNITVASGVGLVTATGFAPSVVASDNKTVLPGVGAVVATGLAPAVAIGVNVTTDTGQAIATGYAPTVVALAPQNVTTDVGQLVATGYAPSVDIAAVAVVQPEAPVVTYGPESALHPAPSRRHHGTDGHQGISGRQTEEWRARMLRHLDDALEAPDEKGLPAKKRKAKRAEPTTEPSAPITASRRAIEGLSDLFAAPEATAPPERPRPLAPAPKRTARAARRVEQAPVIAIIPPPVRVGASPVVAGVRFQAVRLGRVGAMAGALPAVTSVRSSARVAPVVTATAIENPSDEELLLLLNH